MVLAQQRNIRRIKKRQLVRNIALVFLCPVMETTHYYLILWAG